MSSHVAFGLFHFPEFLFIPAVFVFAFVVGSIVGGVKREGGRAVLRGLEAGLLSAIGSILSPLFIGLMLFIFKDSDGGRLFVGWAWFLWHGGIDTIPQMIGKGPFATSPDALLWTAASVGAFAGMFDGLWKVHKWDGPGWITFPIDLTWGLAGTLNGCLFHLVNFIWAGHAAQPSDERRGAHVYTRGFCFKSGFAVTQGNVMSNMSGNTHGSTLFTHEKTHVLQNRIFGPFFTLTYLGWMLVMLVPAFIAGLIKRDLGNTIQGWCYFSNPWEAWAYGAAGQNRTSFAPQIWSLPLVIIFSVIFFAGVIALAVWGGVSVWR